MSKVLIARTQGATATESEAISVRKLGPAIKDSLFDVPQGAPHFGLSKMT